MNKSILILFIFFFVTQCGFSPLHSNRTNVNFSINELKFDGDKTIINYMKTNLNQFRNDEYVKKFNVDINTNYQKNILSKDGTGKVSNYEIINYTTFKISLNGKFIKELKVSEKKNMTDMNDKFEEQKYERTIKQNFASSMSDKLITELSMINDN